MEILTIPVHFGICCILLMLTGCDAQEKQRSPDSSMQFERQHSEAAVTLVYECGEEYTFVARIQNDTAWVFLPGETVSLLQVASESGTRYERDDTRIWVEGEQARLEHGEGVVWQCVNNRRRAIWEHSKLSGADFRAVGNEPGWHMEIHHDKIVVVADYGAATYEFATPEPIEDKTARRTTYDATNESHTLTVLLDGGGCTDTMSGEEFEVAVTVTLDDRTLRGCGRPLH